MQQERRSVNTSESSSRATANNSNSLGTSRPAVTPFQKKPSPSLPEKEEKPGAAIQESGSREQGSLNSSGLVVQRTVEDALAYYSRITNTDVDSEEDVDLGQMTPGQYKWYMRKMNQKGTVNKRPHRRKRKPKKTQTQVQPPQGQKRTRSGSESEKKLPPAKKRKKSGESKREEVGVVTWNIAHFGAGKATLAMNKKKVSEIVDMFNKNKWLDIMVLQEVNNIDLFKKLIANKGVRLLTGGLSMAVLKKTGALGQSEEYPILVRDDSDWELTATASYYPEGGEGIWEEHDDTEDTPEKEEEIVPWSAPKLTESEKKRYGKLTEKKRKDDLPDEWQQYLEDLEGQYGKEETDLSENLDPNTEKNYAKWNENHGKTNVWRDRGGNSELTALIEEANDEVVKFIEGVNEIVEEHGFEQFEDLKPKVRTAKNRVNDAYYRQLQSWINSVLLWLDRLGEKHFEKQIEQLDNHLHNVNTMISIEKEEESTYRPIRRYSIGSQMKNVNLALNVVHTSPSDEGKSTEGKKRKKVFSQISPALKDMSERNNGNELMIGDLYINPKDLVEDGKKAEEVFEEMGVKIGGETTAATNRWSGRGLVRYNQADIILVNNKTKVKEGGIVKRGTGGLEPVDGRHTQTDKWTKGVGKQKALSDHAPVGVKLSLEKGISVDSSKEPTKEMKEKAKKNPFWELLERDVK